MPAHAGIGFLALVVGSGRHIRNDTSQNIYGSGSVGAVRTHSPHRALGVGALGGVHGVEFDVEGLGAVGGIDGLASGAAGSGESQTIVDLEPTKASGFFWKQSSVKAVFEPLSLGFRLQRRYWRKDTS